MKFLHTSDWHVGKTLHGRPRYDEHTDVIGEIIALARAEQVDAVLIAGDLYDAAVPSPRAQQIVNRALIALAGDGTQVVVIAGNHDHPQTFEAYRPLMARAGITLAGTPRPRDQGGVHTFTARSTGEKVNVALLPFVSRRHVVKAEQIVTGDPATNSGRYDAFVRAALTELAEGFSTDAVNLVLAHLTCTGARMGGAGEREAQTVLEYHVPAAAFPPSAHYVALGHLHRRQELPAPCPVHYCGAPIPVDFGEEQNTPTVCIVQAHPGTPAVVTDHPLTRARRLHTLTGTLAEVTRAGADLGRDWARVVLREKARAGLRNEVLDAVPNTLEVRIHPDFAGTRERVPVDHGARTPAELFADYLTQQGTADPRVSALFADLSDDIDTVDQGAGR